MPSTSELSGDISRFPLAIFDSRISRSRITRVLRASKSPIKWRPLSLAVSTSHQEELKAALFEESRSVQIALWLALAQLHMPPSCHAHHLWGIRLPPQRGPY
jgi:hypothetical protein